MDLKKRYRETFLVGETTALLPSPLLKNKGVGSLFSPPAITNDLESEGIKGVGSRFSSRNPWM
jgi:hypothetical protein